MYTAIQRFWPITVLSLPVFSLACNGRYEPLPQTGATLAGTVSFGRQNVRAAAIIVAGPGGATTGHIGDDGRYKVENVPLGDVSIGVNTAAARGEAMGKAMSQRGKGFKMVEVPAKFQDPMKSGIKTNVKRRQGGEYIRHRAVQMINSSFDRREEPPC
jgi:hypothetical protein